MKVIQGLPSPPFFPHPVLTIGNFDGQHVGHRALISAVVEKAQRHKGTPMILTFAPHPARILTPKVALCFLTTPEEKYQFFEKLGIKVLVILEFNQSLANLTSDQFATKVLIEGLGVRDLLVGENFVFGKGRSGNVEDLTRLGRKGDFRVHAVAPVRVDGEIVSSTRIRNLIMKGDVHNAARCLCRPYCLTGSVVHGEGRGAKLGWPTANLHIPSDRVSPPDGVYVTTVGIKGERLDSVSYIGSRPTFQRGERLLEVHVLNVCRELYGEEIQVHFIERLRGDLEFTDVDQLLQRMELDATLAREKLRSGVAELEKLGVT